MLKKDRFDTYMKLRLLLLLSLFWVASTIKAQWRVGVYGGLDYCERSLHEGYDYTNHHDGKIGSIFGITGQYNFNSWLGLRADINCQSRNYNASYTYWRNIYEYRNTYLTLPLMANLSGGSERLRGYVNLGGYIGHWSSQKITGSHVRNISTNVYENIGTEKGFNDSNRRFDAGLAGGIGASYLITPHIAINAEWMIYYGLVNNHNTGSKYYKQPSFDDVKSYTIGITYVF